MFREIILSLHRHDCISREANIDAKVDNASVVSARQQVDTKRKKIGKQQSAIARPTQSISLREQLILQEKEVQREKGIELLYTDSV